MTEAPRSRAVIAAGSPATPAPITTTSADRSQLRGTTCWASAAPAPAKTTPAAPVDRNARRLTSGDAASPQSVVLLTMVPLPVGSEHIILTLRVAGSRHPLAFLRRGNSRKSRERDTRMIAVAIAVLATSAVSGSSGAAEHKCDPITDDGWSMVAERETLSQIDGAPYQSGMDWFVDRVTTVLPFCHYFNSIGVYSMRSYSLEPVVIEERVAICRRT